MFSVILLNIIIIIIITVIDVLHLFNSVHTFGVKVLNESIWFLLCNVLNYTVSSSQNISSVFYQFVNPNELFLYRNFGGQALENYQSVAKLPGKQLTTSCASIGVLTSTCLIYFYSSLKWFSSVAARLQYMQLISSTSVT